MRLLTSYFNYMQHPSGRWTDLFDCSSSAQACLGYFIATLGWVIFFNLGDGLSLAALIFKLLFVFLAEVTVGYFIASLTGIYLSFKKVNVSASTLFVLIGSAGFIKSLLIVWALLCAFLSNAYLSSYNALVVVIVFALQVIYLTRGLKQVSPLTTMGALVAWIAGVFPGVILFFLLGVFGIWGIALLF